MPMDRAYQPGSRNVLWPALAILAVVVACLAADAVVKSTKPFAELPEMVVQEARLGTPEHGYYPLLLETNRGDVECHYIPSPGTRRGVVFLPGAGGSWGGDFAGGLYPRLCEELPKEGIACLRVRYRNADDLLECVLDAVAGIRYLESQGIDSVGLLGLSRGGGVVVYTAAAMPQVRTVVAMSAEGVREDVAAHLGPRCSLLVIHGKSDQLVWYRAAEDLYRAAREPKRLILYPGADHGLGRVADEVHREVYDWIVRELD